MGPLQAVLVMLALAMGGCSKAPKKDLSSPEATLESFFRYLNAGRFPEDLDYFLGDPVERAQWKMRCERRGCTKGSFQIQSTESQGENSVTFRVTYKVTGKKQEKVIGGENSPLTLERRGVDWLLVQFGERLTAPTPGPSEKARPVESIEAEPLQPDHELP